ncbi:glycosyltransferase family 2 protein [uncultured Sphingobacterium sp.]|uniref:glycosyltransferase family 2 protein n=1 Tax=uncultured Sphingobacterium sp. TaxID=182688 RepID=UPI0037487D86
MNFDIIITSYNRPKKVEWLVDALQSEIVNKIIIVDSGNNDFNLASDGSKIIICRSSHKNQPYQRFLGVHNAELDWILFLDDDMEPIEGWDIEIRNIIEKYCYSTGMIGLKFEDLHRNSFLKNNLQSISSNKSSSSLNKLFRKISGYPILPMGTYYKNGVKGALPNKESQTDHVSGGAFLASRKFLYKNVNLELFSLYENRMGKGEDGILSYSISKIAPIIMFPTQLFWHNDQGNSVYTQNFYQFNLVVAFSRLFLNREYYRLNNMSMFRSRLSFVNYSFWRILGLSINFLIRPSKSRLSSLKGYLMGVIKAIFYKYQKNMSDINQYWMEQAIKDSEFHGEGKEKYVK